MYVVGSFFCVLRASLVNSCSSRDARVVDSIGVGGDEAVRFSKETALTKI